MYVMQKQQGWASKWKGQQRATERDGGISDTRERVGERRSNLCASSGVFWADPSEKTSGRSLWTHTGRASHLDKDTETYYKILSNPGPPHTIQFLKELVHKYQQLFNTVCLYRQTKLICLQNSWFCNPPLQPASYTLMLSKRHVFEFWFSGVSCSLAYLI